jgi:hypothetical protein
MLRRTLNAQVAEVLSNRSPMSVKGCVDTRKTFGSLAWAPPEGAPPFVLHQSAGSTNDLSVRRPAIAAFEPWRVGSLRPRRLARRSVSVGLDILTISRRSKPSEAIK